MFKLTSDFTPTGDQPQAIEKLSKGVEYGLKNQVLLGVTGSGKTYTIANIIQNLQIPALVVSHNKTLSAQLFQEFREFFPENAVSYFVSYYDYYQPEAYVPSKDLYIAKEAQINDLIDKLRLQTTANILTRNDVIVVASVSCIYNIGSPDIFARFIITFNKGDEKTVENISHQLVKLHYSRSDFEFKRGSFRIRGNSIDIYPAYEDYGIRINLNLYNKIENIKLFDPITGSILKKTNKISIYPAKQYITEKKTFSQIETQIREDLKKESEELKKQGKTLEAKRLIQRVNYDLEMIKEVGYVNGIENYSRYFDKRNPGDPPYTLIDYFRYRFGNQWLMIIDESHMTIPQIRGMYAGDFSRKKTLVEHGFRLKAAFDNRPLKFQEFYPLIPHFIYVSATPEDWEINKAKQDLDKLKKNNFSAYKSLKELGHNGIAEQLIRPTGIVDPAIEIRPAETEIQDLLGEIQKLIRRKDRILVTTLTKKTAEDLSEFLQEKGIKAYYLHSDIHTLERSDILTALRKGEFDVLVGINLLREGLDLPEVSLVAILDADKQGFLRSKTALIQTMGRAARNVQGKIILYADEITKAILEAKNEIERRRKYQLEYNKKHKIKPKTIYKPIREKIIQSEGGFAIADKKTPYKTDREFLSSINPSSLTAYDKKKIIKKLRKIMRQYAQDMNFEMAIIYRDKIKEIQQQ